jgi:hypothetical protein
MSDDTNAHADWDASANGLEGAMAFAFGALERAPGEVGHPSRGDDRELALEELHATRR